MGIVEDELGASSVFADRSKLDFNYVPPELPHRQDELRQLASLFRVVADQGASQSAFITGPVGTGKTVVSKKFCADFADACKRKQVNVDWVDVNCRKRASEGLALHSILQHFDARYPERGFSTNDMLRDLRTHVDRRQTHLLVILDEADALIAKEGSDLIYALTRFDDERKTGKATLSLLLVSAKPELPLWLDEAARSTLRRTNVIQLQKYGPAQLRDILDQRAKLAFHKGVVEPDLLDLIAEIAAEEGDARYAIELLDLAGRQADEQRADRVEAEHVRAAKAHTRSFVTESKLRLLGEHQLLVLKALGRKLRRSKKPYATTGEVEEAYKLVAEEHEEAPRAHTQFWKYLKELETAGWIRLKEAPRSAQSGNTQQISLPDIPAAILLEKLDEVLKPSKKN